MKFAPHEYQKTAIKWLIKRPEAALFLTPGLGKSACTLAAIKALRKARKVKKTLIIAPLRVCYNVWTAQRGGELQKWDQFRDLKVTLLHGPYKEDALEEDADIYVINFDGIAWLAKEGRMQSLLKRGVDTLVVDELSKLKHPSTKRFKQLKPFLPRFKRRWGLTGSPASNGLLDLFGQCYVLDLGRSLGPYISHYRARYFKPGGFKNYQWMILDGAKEQIYTAIKDLALSMSAEDHLDLPKLIEQNVFVDMSARSMKIYKELEKEFITLIDGKVVTAMNAAVASGKCRQVASGGLYSVEGDKRTTLYLHKEKADALKDLVEELQGRPLLVSYEFDHDLEAIRRGLKGVIKGDIPALNGKTNAKESALIIAKWNAGEIPVLCGHPAAMSHGLNLQSGGCNNVCFYSLTWNFEFYDQLIRRVYRQGIQSKRVIVHRLLARGTVDEVVAGVLSSKKRDQNALLGALKKMAKARKKGKSNA